MTEGHDKIIVFDAYSNVVEANLVKTKLDAYGIPCFLTDEYMTSLYPIRNDIFPGVRLHIFEQDLQQVRDVLNDTIPIVRQCPACKSTAIEFGPRYRTFSDWMAIIAFGILFPVKEIYRCEDCKREFDTIEE